MGLGFASLENKALTSARIMLHHRSGSLRYTKMECLKEDANFITIAAEMIAMKLFGCLRSTIIKLMSMVLFGNDNRQNGRVPGRSPVLQDVERRPDGLKICVPCLL
jgi:hypothetical protein